MKMRTNQIIMMMKKMIKELNNKKFSSLIVCIVSIQRFLNRYPLSLSLYLGYNCSSNGWTLHGLDHFLFIHRCPCQFSLISPGWQRFGPQYQYFCVRVSWSRWTLWWCVTPVMASPSRTLRTAPPFINVAAMRDINFSVPPDLFLTRTKVFATGRETWSALTQALRLDPGHLSWHDLWANFFTFCFNFLAQFLLQQQRLKPLLQQLQP